MNSQRPWRNGWQFVCCTALPIAAPDVGEEVRRADVAGELMQVAVVPGRLGAVEEARRVGASPYQPRPKPSPLVVSAPDASREALAEIAKGKSNAAVADTLVLTKRAGEIAT